MHVLFLTSAHNSLSQRAYTDWSEPTSVIVKKIRSADSQPGVLDTICGEQYYLFGAHVEDVLKGPPGEILAWRDEAICRATGDGAIWITQLKKKNGNGSGLKLPAAYVLGKNLRDIRESALSSEDTYNGHTYREIWYEEINQVGYLHFNFYNGAMSTKQCLRLKEAYV